MELKLKEYLSKIELGDIQQYENIAVVPLFFREDGKIDYLTLKEALDKKAIAVNEVGAGASVPELVVDVHDDVNVLILDGEELFGAKQNRVLNASVLLWGKSSTTIPVSCTEHGRWHFTSSSFQDADNLASHEVRMAKNISVSHSLRAKKGYRSDQERVWDGISRLQESAKVMSKTSAMRDVFEARKLEMEEYLKAFECRPGQKGMLIFINGEIAGFDIISREAAFRQCRAKVLRSYCIEAMHRKERDNGKPQMAGAAGFLESSSNCREASYKSVGRGDDHRFEGQDFTGAALEVDGEVLHMAFLRAA